jgi:DNA-binding transcriptional ArsR family regulator
VEVDQSAGIVRLPSLAYSIPQMFFGIADQTRWAIVCLLASVDELAQASLGELLTLSKPTISYHIGILERTGFITMRKNGRSHFLRLRVEVLEDLQTHMAHQLVPNGQPAPLRATGVS